MLDTPFAYHVIPRFLIHVGLMLIKPGLALVYCSDCSFNGSTPAVWVSWRMLDSYYNKQKCADTPE
jgi:hypothetical protein